MGADLYIKNMDREAQYRGFEVSPDAVKAGYFRDCYNSFGLLGVVAATNCYPESVDYNAKPYFSWWATYRTYQDWFRKDENDGLIMTVEGVKQWKKKILPELKQFLKANKIYHSECNIEDDRFVYNLKELPVTDIEEYRNWAQLLIDFIDLAIKKDSEIIWAV